MGASLMAGPSSAPWLLDGLFALAALFLGVQLVVAGVNALSFPVLRRAEVSARERRAVSLLVPARDEEDTLPRTLPALLAQGAGEVIVLDDGSVDATAHLLAAAGRAHPALRVLRGEPLPYGWTGKNWACWQLAAAAQGDLLLFTDADVEWREGTLDAVLALRQREGADLVSVWPRQRVGSLLERVAVPLIDMVLLAGLPYPAVRRLGPAALAAANGQLMLWTRGGYRRVGGHAAVRGEVLEDVRLGQRAKGAGLRLALALGGERVATRMYRSAGALVEGLSKHLLVAAGSRAALLALLLLNTLAYTLAWPLALLEPRWLAIALAGLGLRALVAVKTGRPALEALLQPLCVWPLWWIGLRALRRGRRVVWKGRTYS